MASSARYACGEDRDSKRGPGLRYRGARFSCDPMLTDRLLTAGLDLRKSLDAFHDNDRRGIRFKRFVDVGLPSGECHVVTARQSFRRARWTDQRLPGDDDDMLDRSKWVRARDLPAAGCSVAR